MSQPVLLEVLVSPLTSTLRLINRSKSTAEEVKETLCESPPGRTKI